MRIAVVGRTGQLARALAEATSTHERVILGREALDLADGASISPALASARPDLVVNAAAYTAVDRAESEPDLAMAVNGVAPGLLAEAAATLGAAIVHVSTDYVFDGTKSEPWVEDDDARPLNVYGATKLAGERAVARAGPRHAILRTSWVYDAGGRNFLTTMLRLAGERDVLRVVDDQRGGPTAAGDLAAAILAMAPRLAAAPAGDPAFGLFHATGAGVVSWAGFAEAIVTGAERRGLIARAPAVERIASADYPTPARRPRNSALDCARLAAAHGVRLAPWEDALARTLDRIAAR